MRCESARKAIEPYLDGETGGADAGELMAHIEGCNECKREFSFQQSFKIAIRTHLPRAKAPAALRLSVERIMGSEEISVPARVIGWLKPKPIHILAGAAVAAVALVAITVSPANNQKRFSTSDRFFGIRLTSNGILEGSDLFHGVGNTQPARVRPGFSIYGLVPADQVKLKFANKRVSGTRGSQSKTYLAGSKLRLKHADLAYAENDPYAQSPALVYTSYGE